MREIGKIVAYSLAVVIGGALLAPPLWWLGQWLIASGWVPALSPFGFSKYFNRAVLLVALALLWPFARWLGLRHWQDLSLQPNPRRFLDLALGFGVGALGLGLAGLCLLLCEQVTYSAWRWDKVSGALLTGAVVAAIEEIFFRGALFGVLRRRLDWRWALAFLSVFFAVLHFIKPDRRVGPITDVTWLSGFALLPHSFWQFANPALVLAGWSTLVVVGWVLGYTVVRTCSLYMAIGLHAGWVFALRSFTSITKRKAPASIWAGRDLTRGLLPLGLLLLTWGFVAWYLRRREAAANVAK